MKYTGRFERKHSECGMVSILEYRSDSDVPYIECSMCKKPIKKVMYVVQDEDGVELMYLGSACRWKFK